MATNDDVIAIATLHRVSSRRINNGLAP